MGAADTARVPVGGARTGGGETGQEEPGEDGGGVREGECEGFWEAVGGRGGREVEGRVEGCLGSWVRGGVGRVKILLQSVGPGFPARKVLA
jgi:hypothetical protein